MEAALHKSHYHNKYPNQQPTYNSQPTQNQLTLSNFSDFPLTSPNAHEIKSFMTSSGGGVVGMTQSPEPHLIKKYTGEEMSPSHMGQSSSDVIQDFRTPINHHTAIPLVNMQSKTSYNTQNQNIYNHHVTQNTQSQEFKNSQTQDHQTKLNQQTNKNYSAQYSQNQNSVSNSNQGHINHDNLYPHNSQQQNFQQLTNHPFQTSQNLKSSFYHQSQKDSQAPQTSQQKQFNNGIQISQQVQNSKNINNENNSNQERRINNDKIQNSNGNSDKNNLSSKENKMLVNSIDLERLRKMMRSQYRQFSDDQIEVYLQKFLKEYLIKISKQENQSQNLDDMFKTGNEAINTIQNAYSDSDSDGMSDPELNGQDFDEDSVNQEPSRDSLSTNLDWNDKDEIQKYCQKQMKLQKKNDFRPSQYFGAVKVEQLADGIDDSRIDELFLDVFGVKPKKRKEQRQEKQKVMTHEKAPAFNYNHSQQAVNNNKQGGEQHQQQLQIPQSQNFKNDQQCKIILNIYNQYQIMNQQDNYQQPTQVQLEDDHATVLQQKPNQQNYQKNNCQVLHQEQENLNSLKQKSLQQDQLKKYMSPTELYKLKHQKATSESIELENTDFQKCCFKTDDNRAQQVSHSGKSGLTGKSIQTQLNSPQSSLGTINRHLYNQSISSVANIGVNQSIQSLSHQTSIGNLNSTGGLAKTSHQSHLSINNKAYKSILYKHQNSNFHSISSQQSLDQKPKQNKLSYLVAKNLPDGGQNTQDQAHSRMNSSSTNGAPKPPHNQTLPITQKMGRDSKDSNNQPYNYPTSYDSNCLSDNSPQVSPTQTLFSQNSHWANNNANNLKLNSKTFTMQHANQTFQSNKIHQLQQSVQKDVIDSGSKTLAKKAQDNFKKAKKSIQMSSNVSINNATETGSSTSRPKYSKMLGRNQSQNLFLSQNQISSVQSFLMSSNNDISKLKTKESVIGNTKNQVKYLETEDIQNSPKIFNKYDQPIFNNTSRPQTAINTNFTLATGINQYVNAASNLGKPPSKLSKAGFLSHNSSTKNLKIFSKGGNMTVATAQNSSKKGAVNYTQINEEVLASSIPNTTRVAANAINHTKLQAKTLDFNSKERSQVRKPAATKSIDRGKLKSSLIQQQYETDLASIERKRQLINQHHKQPTKAQGSTDPLKTSLNRGLQNQDQQNEKKQNQLGRNQSGISKGKSVNQVSEFISTLHFGGQSGHRQETSKSDSQSRMALKITKSIEKITQSTKTTAQIQKPSLAINTDYHNANNRQFANGQGDGGYSVVSSPNNQQLISKTLNFPQSTKNSSNQVNKNQINEMMNHLTSYQSYKKSQASRAQEKENHIITMTTTSVGEHLKNLKSHKSSMLHGNQSSHNYSHTVQTSAHSKSRKDNMINHGYFDPSSQAKKSAEQFKRYLTNGQH